MSLFHKSPPKACPGCGQTDGWHCVPADPPADYSSGAAVNPFSPAPARNTFGQNLTGMKGKSKQLRYRCNSCGYEKNF